EVAHAPYLVTTLVQSDDAMARDCLSTASEELGGQDRLLVVFPEGLMIDRTGGVFAAHDDAGPVRSFGEVRLEGEAPVTVLGVQDEDVPQRRVRGPMWIDVLHEVGRAETITSRRVDPAVVEARFDIELA